MPPPAKTTSAYPGLTDPLVRIESVAVIEALVDAMKENSAEATSPALTLNAPRDDTVAEERVMT